MNGPTLVAAVLSMMRDGAWRSFLDYPIKVIKKEMHLLMMIVPHSLQSKSFRFWLEEERSAGKERS
ncbi:MAG: hypothetical protein H6774_02395 [Pseudomonadales bacterium]|nr:hypothetical protein [Candidatus Woesebacteria bacterium]MCB9801917.1 hypothetical protein [Pseudomonadales bacterium]